MYAERTHLEFVIPSSRMAKMLAERADYHEQRAKEKEDHLPALKEAITKAVEGKAPAPTFSNKTQYNFDPTAPIEEMERDIKTHKAKAGSFRLLSESVTGNDYRLSIAEMKEIELIRL